MAVTVPQIPPKNGRENRIGLFLDDYQGAKSTLCAGCGHDAVTNSIVRALFEMGIEPTQVAKLSGIGCSSKTPNYFLEQAHGFNGVHGRMATIATGATVGNRDLIAIGVSGDGDTASIGLGNFLHMVRRNIPLVYIVENNGCYGLTKGQFSATADKGSKNKAGIEINEIAPVDICALAIQMGCHFVARTFSGDTHQVRTLLKAALSHRGTAVLDIISPCVTFNNHEGSTKSVSYARKNEDRLHDIDYIPSYDPIMVDYEPGSSTDVMMHDGAKVTLKKLGHDYVPNDKDRAMALLHDAQENLHFYTGLMYHDDDSVPFDEEMHLVDEPLAHLSDEVLRPSKAVFDEIMDSYR